MIESFKRLLQSKDRLDSFKQTIDCIEFVFYNKKYTITTNTCEIDNVKYNFVSQMLCETYVMHCIKEQIDDMLDLFEFIIGE